MNTLTISLELTNGVIQVRLLDASGKELAKGQSDVTKTELDTIRDLVAKTKDLTEEIPRSGRKLAGWLLPGSVLPEWQKTPGPVRTVLETSPGLGDIPWEMAIARERLFLNPARPFYRKKAGAKQGSIPVQWPLDILVVLGSSEADLEPIGGFEEERAIREVFRSRNRTVAIRVLRQPDRGQLKTELFNRQPHVLHFIGHGTDSGLRLYTQDGYVTWTDQAILTDITDGCSPPLVYLNACRSTGRDQDDAFGTLGTGQFAPLAQSFFDRGTRAVVAMQADIDGDAAVKCAEAFYTALRDGQEIDGALASARALVDGSFGNEAGRRERRDAYLPVLLVSGSPEDVLPGLEDLQPVSPTAVLPKEISKDKSKEARLSTIVTELVNHDDCRGKALRDPILCAKDYLRVVHGGAETGKSWLLGWCIDGWLRRKLNVRYVPMYAHKNWLDPLRAIVEGRKSLGDLASPLLKAQEAFDAALGMTRNKTGKAKWPATVKLDRKETLEAFHSALQIEAGDGQLLLVLDQFSTPAVKLNAIVFNVLWEHWLQTLVANGDGRVRVILGLSSDDITRYKAPVPDDAVRLKPIREENYFALLNELLRARDSMNYEKFKPNFDRALSEWKAKEVTVKRLSDDCDILSQFVANM